MSPFSPKASVDADVDLIALRAWFDEVELDSKHVSTIAPPDRLEIAALANSDSTRAKGSIRAVIRLIIETRPRKLSRDALRNLVWSIGVLASLLRRQHKISLAAGYLEFAFRLETSVDCLATRAFLFRSAAYLSAEIGDLEMAEVFANNALTLCHGAQRTEGIAESLFAMALVVFWRRDVADARRYLIGAASHAEATSSPALRRAIALQQMWFPLADGDLDEAERIYRDKVQLLFASDRSQPSVELRRGCRLKTPGET